MSRPAKWMTSIPHTLILDEWQSPATHYPLTQEGKWRLHRVSQAPGLYKNSWIDGYEYLLARRPLPITLLQERRSGSWKTWMVDDPPHWGAMQFYAEHAQGKVLVAGLGLGLVCQALAANPEVESITVVELAQDVIHLVGPLLAPDPRRQIVQGDFWNYVEGAPPADTVIVDLWVTHGVENKREVYFDQVLPSVGQLRRIYPDKKTTLTFHGFPSVCDFNPCIVPGDRQVI